ncbi:MAG TPA: GNAT family N-acetyltransferase [Streptosporangiaceae bacterium]|jgi:RimJ/RimL family protein N-acetyltransferase|nr:GNAT family N-acetyltransferase [Streptosporangiaceae bacterium]
MTTVTPEPISTERLRLVPIEPGHADEMAGVLADPALYAFTGGVPPSPDALRERYQRLAAGSPEPCVTWGNWVIQVRRSGRLAGYVQATITAGDCDEAGPPGPEAEVAWVVGPPWQGQGLATEAARALAGWLGRRGMTTIVAHIHPDHHASAAVATALGLSPSGGWHDGERRWQRVLAP